MRRDPGELRRRVPALGRRTRGARIPDELRTKVIRYAMERRRCGDGVREIARTLGVSPESIRRWTTAPARREARALVPIVVRDDDAAPRGAVTLTAPGGCRVEGLTIASVAALCAPSRDRLDAHPARVGVSGARGSACGLRRPVRARVAQARVTASG